jgi:hypothetical protein
MKKRTRESAPPTTGELINRLSHERLLLYRRGAGRPFPRDVRARLVEIVRELDRLWEVRRHELASLPFPLHAAQAAEAAQATPAAPSPKARPRSDREVA